MLSLTLPLVIQENPMVEMLYKYMYPASTILAVRLEINCENKRI